jgi:DNA primase
MAGDEVVLEVAGREMTVTSASKVMFDERGDTKLDLVEYYLAIEPSIMNAVRGRPVLMQRFPHGASGSSFFQKRVPDNAPEWLETTIGSTSTRNPASPSTRSASRHAR